MASINLSTESSGSSLQRSGLNMSVGDTRSIVLALQALQDKIRRLEQDRNHHQDQYEKALQAHEAYKQDMEHQLERERANHRQREKELQDMVQRATAERSKLQATLEESRKDLGTFRTELEEMLMKECEASQKRESALASEVDKLRHDVEEQQKKHRALLVSIENLRAEKDAAVNTNHHLEQAIQEIMQRYNVVGADRSCLPGSDCNRFTEDGRRQPLRPRRNSSCMRSSVDTRAKAHKINTSVRSSDLRPLSAFRSSSGRPSYRDPTYSSSQRDMRSCNVCPPPEGALNHSVQCSKRESRAKMGGSGRVTGEGAPNARLRSAISSDVQPNGAMTEVHDELQEELKNLRQEYKETIERAAAEEINPEVVTAALNRISTLMDRKSEQIRLIKEAQRDLAAAGAVVDGHASRLSHDEMPRQTAPVGADRGTQRAIIVNEIRSLYSQQRP
ncbi:hypothetical protein ERJ75_000975200 [Trypanosoma vivax]|uniref:Uncharacterized protein n=1 Tax=Trypanosoma vivax (strain Y486) TaxID=1055687 RepID=G0U6N9_TRYVY|nr:hypothetical protein ERJ75_000975200 [Trypanosoma vivax]CCC51543.1 conserved hypothetical protein [Trypanosoma vivax Y486]